LKEILRCEICNETVREQFLTACIEHIPEEVDFIDGVVLVLVLARITKVDLRNLLDCTHSDLKNFLHHNQDYSEKQDLEEATDLFRKWTYGTDDARITRLAIGTDHNSFDLPGSVVHLDRLEELCIFGPCGSLPTNELSKLPRLVDLRFHQCWKLMKNFPSDLLLNNLERLEIENTFVLLGKRFLQWMTKQLHQGLIQLKFCCMEELGVESILKFLDCLEPIPNGSLESLCIEALDVDDGHLETLVFAIAPKFSNLSCLDLTGTAIGSVQPIAIRLANDACFRTYIRRLRMSDCETDCDSRERKLISQLPSSPSEHAVVLYRNELNKGFRALRDGGTLEFYNTCFLPESLRRLLLPPIENKDDSNEKAALLSLLDNFSSIYDINDVRILDRGSMYLRQINFAGRRILKDVGGRSFPPSLWPAVLERSFNFSTDPDGPYYLLRHGPILLPS